MIYMDLLSLIVVTLASFYYTKRALAYLSWGYLRKGLFYLTPTVIAVFSWVVFIVRQFVGYPL